MNNPDQTASPIEHSQHDPVALFAQERSRLFALAYRMLGSVSEAEDIVQDAYMRWHRVDHATVEQPAAYLTRLTTRLCLDALKAAQRQRTEYIGPWLPEPLIGEQANWATDDPAALHDLADDLSMAFLLLLERLSPLERAVFLLHESFAFSFSEIAGVLGRSEAACRQLAHRARQHVAVAPHPKPADPVEHDRLLSEFLTATREGNLDGMIALLAPNATFIGDGGGKTLAARRPIMGATNVARMFLGLSRKAAADWTIQPAQVNGRTGLLIMRDSQLYNVTSIEVSDGKITAIFMVVNPDKLAALH